MFILDRIEGKMAVIEWEKGTLDLPLELLPKGVKEGDCLHIQITLDEKQRSSRKEDIEKLAQELWEE